MDDPGRDAKIGKALRGRADAIAQIKAYACEFKTIGSRLTLLGCGLNCVAKHPADTDVTDLINTINAEICISKLGGMIQTVTRLRSEIICTENELHSLGIEL